MYCTQNICYVHVKTSDVNSISSLINYMVMALLNKIINVSVTETSDKKCSFRLKEGCYYCI